MQMELQNIKKSFGDGGSRIEVLKGISLEIDYILGVYKSLINFC